MTDTQKVLTAAIAGAIAGVIAGILFAPESGTETRRRLTDATKKTLDGVRDLATTGASAIGGVKEKITGKKKFYEDEMTEANVV